MNRQPTPLEALLPGVLADLAARHHEANGATPMIRVHLDNDGLGRHHDFASGSGWSTNSDGGLTIFAEGEEIAEFAPDRWLGVEKLNGDQRGGAA